MRIDRILNDNRNRSEDIEANCSTAAAAGNMRLCSKKGDNMYTSIYRINCNHTKCIILQMHFMLPFKKMTIPIDKYHFIWLHVKLKYRTRHIYHICCNYVIQIKSMFS